MRERLPGVVLVAALALAAYALAFLAPVRGLDVAALGVLLGVLVGNGVRLPPRFEPGVAFCAKQVLALSVVLLGLRVTMGDLLSIGAAGAVVVALAVVGALAVALLLARPMGVPRPIALLLGGGTGVCGVATIAALKEVVSADEREVTYAIGAITFLGSLGLLAYPAVQLLAAPLTEVTYGTFSGATLHSVPQAVGAGFAGGGTTAGAAATFVKLARVALLGPVVLGVALLVQGRAGGARAALRLPAEVWGFALLFALGSLVAIPPALLDPIVALDTALLVAALAALGLRTRFEQIRHTGMRPLLLALVTWLALVAAVLLVLLYGGPLL